MKLKSKSSLFHNIITEVDQQLSVIPAHDSDGTQLEDSINFDTYRDSLKELTVTTRNEKQIQPIHTSLATDLVHDELATRREENGTGS
jgi:type II secretory pathway component PulL